MKDFRIIIIHGEIEKLYGKSFSFMVKAFFYPCFCSNTLSNTNETIHSVLDESSHSSHNVLGTLGIIVTEEDHIKAYNECCLYADKVELPIPIKFEPEIKKCMICNSTQNIVQITCSKADMKFSFCESPNCRKETNDFARRFGTSLFMSAKE